MLFSKSLEDKGLDRNDVLQSPNRTLIGDFVRRGQGRYVSAYCLLISITLASEYIIERKDQLPDEEERIANRISELEEEQHQLIEQKTNAILSKEKDKEELQSELNSRQEQYFQAAGRGTAAPNFEDWVEAQENDIEELEDDIEELKTERRWLKQNSDSKNEIERLNEQARELQEAQRRTEDEINKPLRLRSIDRVDALERRMKRKLRVLGQFFDTELDDKAAWLERVRGTASYGNVKACVDEIKGILK
jgi:DNA repair exonuclease SbcCD ATPase subunit